MKRLLQQIRVWLFPPIYKRRAAEIALASNTPLDSVYHVCGRKPSTMNVYGLPKEPCWFVFVPWGDGKDDTLLRSSRVILVSKLSGTVLYDGSANDEG